MASTRMGCDSRIERSLRVAEKECQEQQDFVIVLRSAKFEHIIITRGTGSQRRKIR